jgi:sortase (surface protein transpeptidase)
MPAITSQPDSSAWDVDADWWGPTWNVVTSAGAAEPARSTKPGGTAAPAPAEEAVLVPAVSPGVAADPSWGRILANTIGLWVLRRSSGASRAGLSSPSDVDARVGVSAPTGPSASAGLSAAADVDAPADVDADVSAPGVPSVPSGPSVPTGLSGREERRGAGAAGRVRLRVTTRASAVWGAHARLLSAAMLGAGLLAVGGGAAGLVVARASPPPSVRLTPVAAPSGPVIAPLSLSAVQQQTAKPVSLTIPAIGVKARIINLGLNRNGTLQVPSTTTVVGWYTGGPRPGAIGSAIIAGHVDSYTGPGVFFWLRDMHRGDRIYVRRADGTLAVFTVTAVRLYAKDDFPTVTVYGPVPDAELRLITCGGTFDYASRSYLSNVVVYARLSS